MADDPRCVKCDGGGIYYLSMRGLVDCERCSGTGLESVAVENATRRARPTPARDGERDETKGDSRG